MPELKKKKRKKRSEDFTIEEEGSDHPIHETYAGEESVKR